MSAVSNTRILFWSPFSDSKKLLPVVLSLHSPCKSMVCLVAGCGGSSVLGFLYRDDLQETKVFSFYKLLCVIVPFPASVFRCHIVLVLDLDQYVPSLLCVPCIYFWRYRWVVVVPLGKYIVFGVYGAWTVGFLCTFPVDQYCVSVLLSGLDNIPIISNC